MTNHDSAIRSTALDYAQRYGWAVFPVDLKKRPKTTHGRNDATRDESIIRRYFQNGAQLAAATGKESGLFVLDVDVKPEEGIDGRESLAYLETMHGPLPRTPQQRTGRGGIQYLFNYKEGLKNSQGKLGAGLDTRGDGGYIVVAPSRNTKGPYEWIISPDEVPLADPPQWLVDLLAKKTETATARVSGDSDRRTWALDQLGQAVARVLAAPDGQKHVILRNTARWMGGLVPHLSESEIEAALFGVIELRAEDPENARRTIRDGIAHGKLSPIEPEQPAQPTYDTAGHACCPNCGSQLRPAKNGNGWRCIKAGGELCFWWDGDGYVEPRHEDEKADDLPAVEEKEAPQTIQRQPRSRIILEALEQLGYTFRLNLCTNTVEVNGQAINDPLAARIRTEMRDLDFKGMEAIEDTYMTEALQNAYHPIREYLDGLVWDGEPHFEKLVSHLECSDDPVIYDDGTTVPLINVYLRRWMVGAVAKVYEQAQNLMLVLDGPQDLGKSAFTRWLCSGLPNQFIEAPINPNDKDTDVRLMGHFIWEVSELDATTRRADVSALKAFITKRTVTVRKSYGRHDTVKPALASLVGTVNDSSGFLADETGNRRFFVTTLTRLDWSYDRLDVNQIWAQIVAAYRRGEPWRLQSNETDVQAATNKLHEIDGMIDDWIERYFILCQDDSAMSAAEIADHLRTKYDIRLSGTERAQAMEIARVMAKFKIPRRQRKGRGVREYIGVYPKSP